MTKRKGRTRDAGAASDRRAARTIAFAIFAAALAARVLFWQATPDREWGWTAYYKGDAPVWLEYGRALRSGETFELGLPIRPPATGWLVALLWDGSPEGIAWLRFWWTLIGALVPLLVFIAAERSFGLLVASIAGVFSAASTALLLLSTSINNETPYLVLAIGSFWFIRDLVENPATGRIAMWSAVQAAACLFRADHVLFFVLALGFFGIVWIRRSGTAALRRLLVSLLFFFLPLLPWHVWAWSEIRRFNEEPRRLTPVEERAVRGVEEALAWMEWTDEARRRRDALPGFVRRTGSAFVLATVHHRGGHEIRGEDFDILQEAFGYEPRPLHRFPFIASYGPLNFRLANHEHATGGFDRAPLEQPPPLGGGPDRYPSFLIQGLPPPQLSFVYPPHLHVFNEGYALGWRWIARNPNDFVALAGRKLSIFWSGAALGLTGFDLPLGLSGPRRAVDLVVPEQGGTTTAWRVFLLALAVLGASAVRRHLEAWPWLLLLLSKVLITVLFFGYARQGATAAPVLAVLIGLAAEGAGLLRRSGGGERRAVRTASAVLLLAVSLEAGRLLTEPVVRLGGRVAGAADPFPTGMHEEQQIDVE